MSTAKSNIISNASAVAQRLAQLKAAAAPGAAWWTPALRFAWSEVRTGNNATQWVSVLYTDAAGITAPLTVRFFGERHTGQIMPMTDAALAELQTRFKAIPGMKPLEKRTKKPALQFQKWSVEVKTVHKDSVEIPTDADGKPILPGDDKLSQYYRVASLVGEAFLTETSDRKERGEEIVAKVKEMVKANPAVKGTAVLEAFAATLPADAPRRPGDTIFSKEQQDTLRKLLKAEAEIVLRGALIAGNMKVAPLTQELISEINKTNGGKPMPNPIARLNLDLAQETSAAKTQIFDKSKPFIENGKQRYEQAKVDGVPVNAENIHKFLLSRSRVDGVASLDTVCFSSMGISMPTSVALLVVGAPVSKELDLDDLFGGEGGELVAAPAVTEAAAPAATAPATPAPESVEDFDSLLGELSTDQQ
jgi:hypothetical protein